MSACRPPESAEPKGWGFVVQGNPVPKARARAGKGRFRPCKRSERYEQLVGAMALRAGLRDEARAVSVRIDIWRATGQRYDVDNVAKAVLDGMVKHGALRDDAMVIVARVVATHRGKSDRPRVEVRVDVVGDEMPVPRPRGWQAPLADGIEAQVRTVKDCLKVGGIE